MKKIKEYLRLLEGDTVDKKDLKESLYFLDIKHYQNNPNSPYIKYNAFSFGNMINFVVSIRKSDDKNFSICVTAQTTITNYSGQGVIVNDETANSIEKAMTIYKKMEKELQNATIKNIQ